MATGQYLPSSLSDAELRYRARYAEPPSALLGILLLVGVYPVHVLPP